MTVPRTVTTAFTAAIALTAATTSAAASAPDGAPPAHSNAAFSFGLIADVQYWDGPTRGTRYYSDSIAKLSEAAATINTADVEFTVQVGDLIDRDAASFGAILPVWEQITGPRYSVLGNHDFPDMTSEQVVPLLEMENQYYDWSHQNWRFIVLDTTDISLFANTPGSEDYQAAEQMLTDLRSEGAVNAQTWNGGAGPEQLTWLAATLEDADTLGQNVVVFGHMPINGENIHNAWDAEAIQQVLQTSDNVVAYFNGHDHAGRYAYEEGIHYVNLKGMVENGWPANAYSIVTVQHNRIRIDGFGAEPDRILRVNAD